MVKKLTLMFACLFLSMGMAMAQTQASGTVISSEDGQPVIGATVMLVGSSSNGTMTDYDGKFTLSVPANAKLRISSVGMKTREVTAGRGT